MIKIRRQAGFSLVELLITVVVFALVIVAASNVFTGLLTQFKQQSKIAETNIEGIIGLEILRRDIEHAGYGLPWDLNGAVYLEATDNPESTYNDAPGDPPRAIVSGDEDGDNVGIIVDTDVLVVKAISVARNDASSKWTHLYTGNTVKEWEPDVERLQRSARVIVLSPESNRSLVLNAAGDSFTTRYRADSDPDMLVDAAFAPAEDTDIFIVYGVTNEASPVDTDLMMPFNRADYYVRRPDADSMPLRCADGTGILYKATVNQGTGTTVGGGLSELPLFDCVADMQVVYRSDTDNNGDIDTTGNDLSDLDTDGSGTADAQEIRDQLREIRVYILAHEGQKDPDFTFTNLADAACGDGDCIMVGEIIDEAFHGRYFVFDEEISGIADYENYRWKVYTIVVKPTNLR